MNDRHGERPDTPADRPAPVITSKARTATWEYDTRQTGANPRGGAEPAPTIMSSGLAKGRDVWKYRNGNQANAAERPATEPAPTVHFGHASNAVDWVHDRPAPTVVGSRRSEDGMLVGRQLPPGEGRNVGGRDWVNGRPATTVAGDPRIAGHKKDIDNPDSPGRMTNAVRVSVQEASILQSFPPDYPWQGSRTKQYEQIGNAVPPTMAQAVLGALLDSDRMARRPAGLGHDCGGRS